MSKKNLINILECLIDNARFNTHRQFLYHLKKLKISEKSYFDLYLRTENSGRCNTCNNLTEFSNIGAGGYKKYCSHQCSQKNETSRLQKKENTKKALIVKYGVDNASKIEGFGEKVKKTKFDRYGSENYTNLEKSKETSLLRYGVQFFTQTDTYKEKSKSTSILKYGTDHPTQAESVKSKSKSTCLEKYGVEHVLSDPNMRKRISDTTQLKYGGFTLGSPILREKFENTCLERYGNKNPRCSTEVSDKIKTTSLLNGWNVVKDRLFENVTPMFDSSEYLGSKEYQKFKCNICNSVFENTVESGKYPRCESCFPKNRSIAEIEICEFLTNECFQNIEIKNKDVLCGKELDIYIRDKNFAIEFNGLYWHSEPKKSKSYHREKTEMCLLKNIKLIHIFEDEWRDKKEIVKSKIKRILKIKTDALLIYARKCKISEIDSLTCKEFLEKNHIQGNCISEHKIGMFFGERLIACATFSSDRKIFGKSSNSYEIVRYCTDMNCVVVGGFSKIISNFSKKYNIKHFHSYADFRWSSPSDNLYEKSGFKLSHISKPGYFYVKNGHRYHRSNFMKHKLKEKLELYDSSDSEVVNMEKNGYKKIYDCGCLIFIKHGI